MYKTTQIIIDELDYIQIAQKLLAPNPTNSGFHDQVIYKTIAIIALTSGLPIEYILSMKWDAILYINSKGQPQIHKEINITRYTVYPVSTKLHEQLSEFYKSINRPLLNSRIVGGLSKGDDLASILIGVNYAIGFRNLKGISKEEAGDYRNKYLLQILYGRRIFEVYGCTNKTKNYLKVLFRINSNKELFKFLGYSSGNVINYSLSKISLIEGEGKYIYSDAPSYLDDNKHFDTPLKYIGQKPFPFQHFHVFYDFLNQVKLKEHAPITQGIVVLLMLSLTSGVRLSTLLRLKWSDLFSVTKEGFNLSGDKTFLILKKTISFERFQVAIDKGVSNQILTLFMGQTYNNGFIAMRNNKDVLTFINNLPILDQSCFLSNRGNPLMQNSLNREMIKALGQLKFNHTKKFTIKSTLIMYGRRVIELKGNYKPIINLLKENFKIRTNKDLFDFLYIDAPEDINEPSIKEFQSRSEYILYDI